VEELMELISYVSQFYIVKNRNVFCRGTPEGVAAVKPDDVLEGF
jgi:2-keto-4-pentenoate hydratase/2-oxohepta-3-ene-1,7-dioic acid hydratase in catechol pathway